MSLISAARGKMPKMSFNMSLMMKTTTATFDVHVNQFQRNRLFDALL